MNHFLLIHLKKLILLGYLTCSLKGFATNQNEINKRIEHFQQQTKKQLVDNNLMLLEKQCTTCTDQSVKTDENLPVLLVFTSFSMPDSLWVSLSQELEAVGGAFILQGLPSNSFKELANKIYELRQKNVNADIQLHPQLFQDYQIHHVPTFVLIEKDKQWNQLEGNVSLDFALNQFNTQCQSQLAPLLLTQLRGSN